MKLVILACFTLQAAVSVLFTLAAYGVVTP